MTVMIYVHFPYKIWPKPLSKRLTMLFLKYNFLYTQKNQNVKKKKRTIFHYWEYFNSIPYWIDIYMTYNCVVNIFPADFAQNFERTIIEFFII